MSGAYLALAFFATVAFCGACYGIRDAMRAWAAWTIANMPAPREPEALKPGPDNNVAAR